MIGQRRILRDRRTDYVLSQFIDTLVVFLLMFGTEALPVSYHNSHDEF